jgi:hypothetical protein
MHGFHMNSLTLCSNSDFCIFIRVIQVEIGLQAGIKCAEPMSHYASFIVSTFVKNYQAEVSKNRQFVQFLCSVFPVGG